MTNAFDQIAKKYDAGFGNTTIGKMQRKVVWNYIDKNIGHDKQLNILELNCGTGDDALWFAAKGHNVMATDASEKMLEIAQSKSITAAADGELTFSILDIAKKKSYPTNKKFDLVFSNFGGFNCISHFDFKNVIPAIAELLSPKGRIVAVIMPKFCLWESVYFMLKGKPSEVFRRNTSKPVKANIGNYSIDTWYYAPTDIVNIARKEFKMINKLPVGIAIPPSYLNNYFSSYPFTYKLFQRLESTFGSLSFLSGMSDHYIIDLEVKS